MSISALPADPILDTHRPLRSRTPQRNYNTQPRILGAAQDRLSHTIAEAFAATAGTLAQVCSSGLEEGRVAAC